MSGIRISHHFKLRNLPVNSKNANRRARFQCDGSSTYSLPSTNFHDDRLVGVDAPRKAWVRNKPIALPFERDGLAFMQLVDKQRVQMVLLPFRRIH